MFEIPHHCLAGFYTALYWIGVATCAKFTATLTCGLYRSLFRKGKQLKRDFGDWAVVTGATDGIGHAFCGELAKQGINIVLISRTQEKLDRVAKELSTEYNIVTKTVAVDYSKLSAENIAAMRDTISEVKPGILINNVGMSYSFPQYFHELNDETARQILSLNVKSTTLMTRLVLAGMVQRKKGAIVNLSSGSARGPMPLLSEYAASKSFIEIFSQSLYGEYASRGVHVQCQTPFFVTTKLSKIRRTSLFVCSPKAYARAAVRCIGYEPLCVPYWSHKIQAWILSILPDFLISKYSMMLHLPLRARALKKLAKDM